MESGQLKDNQQYADGTINEPKTKDISNCLTARQDGEISNQRSEEGW